MLPGATPPASGSPGALGLCVGGRSAYFTLQGSVTELSTGLAHGRYLRKCCRVPRPQAQALEPRDPAKAQPGEAWPPSPRGPRGPLGPVKPQARGVDRFSPLLGRTNLCHPPLLASSDLNICRPLAWQCLREDFTQEEVLSAHRNAHRSAIVRTAHWNHPDVTGAWTRCDMLTQ